MLSKEERKRPYPSYELFGHLRGDRGKRYFYHLSTAKDRYYECYNAILDIKKGVIVSDDRKDKESTHLCLFINGCGENIVLPLIIEETGRINIMTIKNIAESIQDPKWFYNKYNEIAKTRDMPLMQKIWRPDINGKY